MDPVIVMPPSGRGAAIIALGSMYSCSWWPTRYSPSMTRSAAASAASTSPARHLVCRELLPDRSGSSTGSSGSMRTVSARRAARRVARSRGREQRNRLRVMANLVVGERGLVGLDGADDVLARDVRRGHQDHLRPVERGVPLDAQQPRAGDRGADGRAIPAVRGDQVVRVARGAGELLDPFAAQRQPLRTAGHDRVRRHEERRLDGGRRGLGGGGAFRDAHGLRGMVVPIRRPVRGHRVMRPFGAPGRCGHTGAAGR